MLKYFIAVSENLLPVAIIIGLLFAAAGHADRRAWIKDGAGDGNEPYVLGSRKQKTALWIGICAGIAGAIVLACLTQFTRIVKRGYWNIWFMIIALAAMAVFLIFLWGALRKKAPGFNHSMLAISGAVLAGDLLFYSLPACILFPTEFVLQDESIASTDFLLKFIGLALAFLLAILTVLAAARVVKSLHRTLIRILVSIIFAISAVSFSGIMIQSMFNRWIKVSSGLFNYSNAVVNNSQLLLVAMFAVGLIFPVVLWPYASSKHEEYKNSAEKRKLKAGTRNKRRWATFMIVLSAISMLTVTVIKAYDEREVVLSPAEPFELAGEEIHIPAEQIEDGHLHRFEYQTSDGIGVRFIVIKKNDVSYGVGLDACDICGETGYYERDGQVVCKLCDVVMNKSTIGFKGGCNPIPLTYTMNEGKMVIQTADLESEKSRFK